MGIFKNSFKKKLNSNPDAISIILNFVEGKISFDDFWRIYTADEILINELKTKENELFYRKGFFDSLERVQKIDVSNIVMRVEIFRIMEHYLRFLRQIKNTPCNDEHEYLNAIESIIPNWLYAHRVSELIPFFADIDESLPLLDKKIMYKDIIDNAFKCKEKRPYWLQPSEWPIMDNGPLLFAHQDGNPDDNNTDVINYFFVNEETGEEIIITQFT